PSRSSSSSRTSEAARITSRRCCSSSTRSWPASRGADNGGSAAARPWPRRHADVSPRVGSRGETGRVRLARALMVVSSPENPMTKRVGVLMGGVSAEREVSLRTGEGVANALEQRGNEVVRLVWDGDGAGLDELVRQAHVDAVFLALHGRGGEDGCA